VQDGTLKAGDVLLCGSTYGRIRRVLNDRGEPLSQATASMPVLVSGLSGMPNAGDKVFQVEDLDRARQICEDRAVKNREKELASKTTVSLENLLDTIEQQSMKEVRLIIKADVAGSVETLAKTVVEASGDEVKIVVIHAAAGPISESDVELADASKAVIIGFNVVPDDSARAMAEHRRIEVRLYRVIYEILDDLKKAMSGMLEPEIREKHHGRAEVRQVFKVSKVGNIAGCMATEGHIQRGSKIRLIRNGAVVVEDLSLESLRRIKEDVKEVKQGFECGMKLAGYDDIKVGDIFEAYIRETIQRTL
jgi:translation initiation factor IF-2